MKDKSLENTGFCHLIEVSRGGGSKVVFNKLQFHLSNEVRFRTL